jgi:hypothetical protein
VHKEDFAHRADGNEGHWHFVENAHRADVRVYFSDSRHRADLTIYYVDFPHRAGWQKEEKRGLLGE